MSAIDDMYEAMKAARPAPSEIVVSAEDLGRLERPAALFGMRVTSSPFVKPGQAVVVNTAALDLALTSAELRLGGSDALEADFLRRSRVTFLAEMRAEIGLRGRWVPEQDPAARRPTSLVELVRQMAAIVGYEFRKAAGRPRRRWEGPRDAFLITGLTA